jgi:hypothetical protein
MHAPDIAKIPAPALRTGGEGVGGVVGSTGVLCSYAPTQGWLLTSSSSSVGSDRLITSR